MKCLLYLLVIAVFASCNTKKPVPTQNYVVKPEDLASLNERMKTPVVNPSGTATALNPAHGQPGHRCDIAVGAPLNAIPNKTTAPNVQTVPTPQPTTVVQQPTVTNTPSAQTATVNAKGEKLNPAHGQPNHRCDIAVGAPLNAKPTQVAATTANPKVTVTQPASTNVQQVPLLNEKGQRLNPAHGQPNHRCDIAVGAPLT